MRSVDALHDGRGERRANTSAESLRRTTGGRERRKRNSWVPEAPGSSTAAAGEPPLVPARGWARTPHTPYTYNRTGRGGVGGRQGRRQAQMPTALSTRLPPDWLAPQSADALDSGGSSLAGSRCCDDGTEKQSAQEGGGSQQQSNSTNGGLGARRYTGRRRQRTRGCTCALPRRRAPRHTNARLTVHRRVVSSSLRVRSVRSQSPHTSGPGASSAAPFLAVTQRAVTSTSVRVSGSARLQRPTQRQRCKARWAVSSGSVSPHHLPDPTRMPPPPPPRSARARQATPTEEYSGRAGAPWPIPAKRPAHATNRL